MIKKMSFKKVVVGLIVVGIMVAPIFRYNLVEDKYMFSILESMFRKDVPTVELVVGNIYSKIMGL